MKIQKLNARGFSHDIMIVLFVVLFAIGGVAYLVASHADECNPVSGPMSGTCTFQPTAAVCNISNVPIQTYYGEQINPVLTITNTGGTEIVPTGSIGFAVPPDPGDKGGPFTGAALQPGQTATIATGLYYSVGYSTAASNQVTFTASSTTPEFTCSASAPLPPPPVPPPPVKNILAAVCKLSGVPSTTTHSFTPAVNIVNTGNILFSTKVAERVTTYSNNKASTSIYSYKTPQLQLGSLETVNLHPYSVPLVSTSAVRVRIFVSNNTPAFSCSATFNVPSHVRL